MRLLPGIALAISLIALGLFISSDVAVAAVEHDVRVVRFKTPNSLLTMAGGVDTSKPFLLQIQNRSDHADIIRVRVQAVPPANCTVNGNAGTSIVFDTVTVLNPGRINTFSPAELTLTFNCSVVTPDAFFFVTACVDHNADSPFGFDPDDDFEPDNCQSVSLLVQ